jgi:hypothetical protein
MITVPSNLATLGDAISLGDGLSADMVDAAEIHTTLSALFSASGAHSYFVKQGSGYDALLGGCLRLSLYISVHINKAICGFHNGVFSYECLASNGTAEAENCLPVSVWSRMSLQEVHDIAQCQAPEWLGEHVLSWLHAYHQAHNECFEFNEGYAP